MLLLPNQYKRIGWIILIPSTILGIALVITDFEFLSYETNIFALLHDSFGKQPRTGLINTNIVPTAVGALFIIGALMVSFSREKMEDEFIARLRQTSLIWAVVVNYILLFFSMILIYGFAFLNVMVYQMFTVLIIFIIRFNYLLYKSSKVIPDEKYNQSTTGY